MEWWLSLIIVMLPLMCLLAFGMHVAFAFLVVDIAGLWFFSGNTDALWMVVTSAYTALANYSLLPVALFMLMGEALFHSGLANMVMDLVDSWIGHIRARLAIVSIATGTVLSTMTGVAMGDVAILGAVLCPEMVKRGYSRQLTYGSILASGTMAAIIPPSSLAVLYGSLAKVSIAGMLIGGILPGLLLAFMYVTYVLVLCHIKPHLAPVTEAPVMSMRKKISKSLNIVPFGFIVFMVIGVIMLGIGTPTEAAGTGALATYLVALAYRRLDFAAFKKSLAATVNIFGMVFIIFVGSVSFSQLLAFCGATAGLAEFAAGLDLGPVKMFVVLQVLIFLMAMFIDQISIMMITIPIFMPVLSVTGIDPLWFGIVYLVNIVVGGKTPPFGLMAFTLKGAYPASRLEEIYRGVIPFICVDMVAMALMIAFPQICLFLPSLL